MRYILLLTILLAGCNPCKRLIKKCPPSDSVSYVEIIKEDPSFTIPDSVHYRLLFECDSNFNVLLKDFEETNTGVRTEVVIREVPKIIDRVKYVQLEVDLSVYTDSIGTLNRTIEKLRNQTRTIVKEVKRPLNRFTLIFSVSVIILLGLYIYGRVRGILR